MSNEFWAAIWGALAGSTVAGLISFALQLWGYRRGVEERRRERLDRDQALVFSLVVKVNRIASRLHEVAKWIDEAYAGDKGEQTEPWQFVRPMLNPPAPVHFEAPELGVVFSKDAPLYNDLAILDETLNSALVVVTEFGAQRGALYALLRPTELDANGVGGLLLTEKDFPILAPRMFEVNAIADSLKKSSGGDAESALDLSHRLIQFGREKLEMTIRVKEPRGEPDRESR